MFFYFFFVKIYLFASPAVVACLAKVLVEVAFGGEDNVRFNRPCLFACGTLSVGLLARRGVFALHFGLERDGHQHGRLVAHLLVGLSLGVVVADGEVAHEVGLLVGDMDNGVLSVGNVIEEGFARGGLLLGLRVLGNLLVEPRLLLGSVVVSNSHLTEENLELLNLPLGQVLDGGGSLGHVSPDALRRAGSGDLGSVPDRSSLGLLELVALALVVLGAHQLSILVVVAAGAGTLLGDGFVLLLRNLLMYFVHPVHPVGDHGAAVRHALGVLLATLLARGEAGAELRRVSLLVAVSALVLEQEGAGHCAVLLVLNPVARELLLGALRVEAEAAELSV